LFTLIVRGVSFEFRSKVESAAWRKFWDACAFVGSIAPAVLFGVAFANIFRGIPIDGEGVYQGNLLTLLNPYGLLGGILFLLLFLVHGALWLSIRSEGELQQRAVATAAKLWPVELAVAVIFLVASMFATRLYDNYIAYPYLFIIILLAVAGLLGIKVFLARKALFRAWFASALTIAAAVFYGVIGLFPNMFPSNIDPSYSLTAHNAASSALTLKIMLVVVILFVPIVLVYQAWAYNLFKGKVKQEDLVY
jgi:cytochrome d ubiquinol oxidase subunit II